MFVRYKETLYHEDDAITFDFGNGLTRKVRVFDLVLARRALQDAIIARIMPDTDEDVLMSSVHAPMFDEDVVLKFDPEGLMFFVLPLKRDHDGVYVEPRSKAEIEYVDEE